MEADGLSGAILDYRLGDGDAAELCARLHQRGVPFVIYTGYDDVPAPCEGVIVHKSTGDAVLVDTMKRLLS